MLFMLDNYDSFTYNLVQYIEELGVPVQVARNNHCTVADIEELNPDYICISPGPSNPDHAGISLEVIQHFAGKIPLLGVCLGHQAIAQAFGGRIIHAKEVMHGKVSAISHNNSDVFQGLPNPLTVTRYHSLAVDPTTLPDCLTVTAQTNDGEIMGLCHKEFAISGVQFHPESILSECGKELLQNFLQQNK